MAVVKLGGRDFEVTPLPIRKSREWRQKFQEPFDVIAASLAGAGRISLDDGVGLAQLLTVLKSSLLGSVEILLDMLFAYSETLQAERQWIEDHATDDEAMQALVEVIRQAYPLGRLRGLLSGQQERAT